MSSLRSGGSQVAVHSLERSHLAGGSCGDSPSRDLGGGVASRQSCSPAGERDSPSWHSRLSRASSFQTQMLSPSYHK